LLCSEEQLKSTIYINPLLYYIIKELLNRIKQGGLKKMFMQIAIGAIGIGIVLMVGFLVISQVNSGITGGAQSTYTNPCYGHVLSATECANATTPCYLNPQINTSATCSLVPHQLNNSLASTQTTIFAGFGLLAVGIIVLAAFGLINVFQ
jgi:hypothetical protein